MSHLLTRGHGDMADHFFEQGSESLLTPPAFEFVLGNELHRALRSQSFLTLVVFEAQREWEELFVAADDETLDDVAQLVARSVRATDLVSKTDKGLLSLALLDADFDSGAGVVGRLMSRIVSYNFQTPLRIAVGAACYPTHAVDADSLKREAASHPLVNWRGSLPKASND
jgi:hypothetical protein